ncbi:MAG: PadR family transcriptional regulator [Clostridia bacterium]|nr:PadR family transcriptional regulator [Clostridia bacterium]
MENTIQSDLIRGHINTIILKALFDGDRYGYDIVREIEQKSSGQYKLKQPTLYSCLKRLEIQGFIRSYWGAKSNGGRRKYFTLTDMGRELFIKNQSEWEYSRTVIDKLISDKEYDLSTVRTFSEETTADAIAETADFEDEPDDEIVAENETSDNITEDTSIQTNSSEIQDDSEQELAQQEVTKQQIEFSDTTAIMNELFRRQLHAESDASYADKLISEKYVSDRTDTGLSSEGYFTDFFAAQEADTAQEEFNVQKESDPFTPLYTPPIEQTAAENDDSAPPPPTPPLFFDYHTSSVTPTPETNVIEREYKNILGDFLNPSFVEHAPVSRPVIEEQPAPETYDETADAISEEETDDQQDESLVEDLQTTYTADADVNRKLNKLTGEVREMGDNVIIRTHNSNSSKEYSHSYYYYANKLMLIHYGILFGIMMLEILFSAVFVNLVLHAGRNTDKWFYIGASVLAAVFPLAAFIKNVTAPTYQKRINFSLKNSLIYRLIVMAQCFLIIYCLNIIANMPIAFSIDYITTLLLPALLCTNFPVSAILFHTLFKSKKFSVEK